jgi:hypothetical protein
MRGVCNCEREFPVEKNVCEKVNQFEQSLRHQAADQAYKKRIPAYLDYLWFEGYAELALFTGLRFWNRFDLWNWKVSPEAPP